MLTLGNMLVTVEKHLETLLTTLHSDEKQQFLSLLTQIDLTLDDTTRENRIDALFNFCLGFPFLKQSFGVLIGTGNISERGRQIFEPTEKELVYLIRNRLIKATEESLSEEARHKDTKEEKKKPKCYCKIPISHLFPMTSMSRLKAQAD